MCAADVHASVIGHVNGKGLSRHPSFLVCDGVRGQRMWRPFLYALRMLGGLPRRISIGWRKRGAREGTGDGNQTWYSWYQSVSIRTRGGTRIRLNVWKRKREQNAGRDAGIHRTERHASVCGRLQERLGGLLGQLYCYYIYGDGLC